MLIAIEQDTWTVWFDGILARVPGPSAQDALAERLWNWDSHYEAAMCNRLCSDRREQQLGSPALLMDEEELAVVRGFHERVEAARRQRRLRASETRACFVRG